MCRALKSQTLKDLPPQQTLEALKEALRDLKEIVSDTDFSDSAHVSQFKANISYLKTYYEQLERGLRYGDDEHVFNRVDTGFGNVSGDF